MKQSLKAALMSGLVFPGLGQILFLKKPARGCIFLIPSLVSLFYILHVAYEQATLLAAQITNGTLAFDVTVLAAQIAASRVNGPTMTAATLACVLCWSASILDAILFGNDHHHHHVKGHA
ncbi:MAG: hypothetical protein K2X55_07050 [Burkholderiaceae bacterium]|nr:hypothetical protein [Burkholderiaceae bacterium]